MAQALSAENLVKCLVQKDKYKATQSYLHEVSLFNETVYQMFNYALSNVLLKPNRNYMSKLMALRLFKEVIVTANFTLIDALDQKIQDLILAVAQYNKKSKQINRGANYFIEVDKQKKEGDILKIGATFVLLASEILVVLAKWYPMDQDGEQSRFAQYFKELINGAVPLPQQNQLNFFKKEDQEKFRKNYSSWLKWYVQKVKEEDIQQTTRQIKEETKEDKKEDKKEGKKEDKKEEKKEQKKEQKNEEKKEKKEEEKEDKKEEKKQEKKEQKPVQKVHQRSIISEKTAQIPKVEPPLANNSTLNISPQTFYQKSQIQKVETKVQKMDESQKSKIVVLPKPEATKQETKDIQKEKLEYQKWKQQMISKYQKELNTLRGQNNRIKKQVDQATSIMSKVQDQKVSLSEQLQRKKKEMVQLAQQKQQLQNKINTLNKPEMQPKEQTSECFQIKISPPQVYEQLEDQNEVLQSALQAAQTLFMKKKQQLQQQLSLIREENSKLSRDLLQKEQEIKKCKEEVNVQKQVIQSIIREDSLVITEEVKLYPLQNKRQFSEPKHKQDVLSKTCSMSEYLKNNHRELRQNVQPRTQSRNKSLRKTQSTHKMSTLNTCQPFYNTGFNTTKNGNSNQKLAKTSNAFYSKKAFQTTSSNLITIFPFLQSYFSPLPAESKQFKPSCLSVANKLGLCYENDLVKVSLKKISLSKYIVIVSNKLNFELKLKLASELRSFVVEGDRHKKIKPFSSQQIEISNVQFDINLRYVTLSFVSGNQKLSLTNSSPYDRTFNVPLPITLLDFCKLRTDHLDYLSQRSTSKYCSNKLALSSCHPNLIECLASFKVNYIPGGVSAKVVAELNSETESKVLIQVIQTQYEVCVSVEFLSNSLESSNLGKVLLQVILFLIQV